MQKIGKEVKIGLAVIGVLLVAFGYVLVKKLTQSDSPNDSVAGATAPASGKDTAERPTMVTASDSDHAADAAPNRSRWATESSRDPKGLNGKQGDPAFASTAREAQAFPEPRGASRFAGDDDTTAASGDSGRRNGRTEDQRFGGAVQASDSAPVVVSDNAAPPEAHSVFAKPEAGKAATDRDPAGENPTAAGKSAADPFQRRSADAAPASDPFQRRGADSSPAADPFQRKSPDGSADARDSAAKSFADRNSSRPNSLTAVEDPGLKPTASGDSGADSRNPLRRADAQPAADTADNGNRWSNQSRFSQADSAAAAPTTPARAGSTFDSAGRSEPPNRFDAAARTDAASRLDGGVSATSGGSRFSPAGSAPQPLVADESAAKPGQYIVQPNDNYWTISEKVYGMGGYFKAIYEQNRRQHPTAERLQVGETLQVPDVAVLQRDYPDLCPKPGHAAAPQKFMPASARIRPGTRAYAVEEGDTLFEIARRQLGKPSRWGEIYQLNREVLGSDFDYLKPGTELLLPTDGRPEPIARQPNGTAEK